ncbi:unnamed protein product [Orchesella dallaii]|uniref:Uncharacterized protein n=1 Tax=Orchesella dallaii TaxID=48710 RepID=A0ABP1Q1R3_9HEXA
MESATRNEQEEALPMVSVNGNQDHDDEPTPGHPESVQSESGSPWTWIKKNKCKIVTSSAAILVIALLFIVFWYFVRHEL